MKDHDARTVTAYSERTCYFIRAEFIEHSPLPRVGEGSGERER